MSSELRFIVIPQAKVNPKVQRSISPDVMQLEFPKTRFMVITIITDGKHAVSQSLFMYFGKL